LGHIGGAASVRQGVIVVCSSMFGGLSDLFTTAAVRST
jgi:hypothetical protein